MRIVSIEPTPSPYSMKIIVDETLDDGKTEEYKTDDDLSDAPEYVRELFKIEGVKEIYRVINFIALERTPKVPWENILQDVKNVLGSVDENEGDDRSKAELQDNNFGEIKVFIQKFRNIPMQVKLEENGKEKRFGLPSRFMDAAMEASKDADLLAEREWIEQSPRYGDADEIGQDVVAEIEATYDQERLNALVKLALADDQTYQSQTITQEKLTMEALDASNWKDRYAALDRMPDPTVEDLPALAKALNDPKMSIRRLATAYLGEINDQAVLPYIYKALDDPTVTVRRTAGDCLSDLGFKEAIPKMVEALKDKSRIVRWRAAMFLYEYGDETALPALEEALQDPEFEVRMQAKMARSRIQEGEEAKGSIWKQMMEMTKEKNEE